MSLSTLILVVLAQVGIVDPDTVPTVEEPIVWTTTGFADSSTNDKNDAEQVQSDEPIGSTRISNGF